MKKFFLTVLILFGLMITPAMAYTLPKITEMTVNGEKVALPKAPFIQNDITMVPMRVIFEALQAQVDYNDKTQVITASRKDTTVTLTLGSTIAVKNGTSFDVGVVTREYNGVTMVPLRFVSEALNAQVEWLEDTQTIIITLEDREIKFVLGEDTRQKVQQVQTNNNNNQWGGYASEREAVIAGEINSGGTIVTEAEFNEARKNGGHGDMILLEEGNVYVIYK